MNEGQKENRERKCSDRRKIKPGRKLDLQKRMKKRINDKDMDKYNILSHLKNLFKICLFKVKVIIMYCGICNIQK